MAAMAMYPEVLKKAHEEIDRVIGPNRLPDMGDIDSLPYVSAIVKESLRWKLVVPTGTLLVSLGNIPAEFSCQLHTKPARTMNTTVISLRRVPSS